MYPELPSVCSDLPSGILSFAKRIISMLKFLLPVPTPGHIYLGTASRHIHFIFCLYSANYMFVEFSSQLGIAIMFHKINGLQVMFTSSVAPMTPGGI